MLHCERQKLRQTTSWEEPHRNVCDCICMTALGFTVFLLYFTSILLYLPYFYCISLFQASVALMFTDLNLVLLLYYFIIALSRFLNLKWALCLIKSKLQVHGLRGLPRVTPKVASNSHHCFSVCLMIQTSNWRLFDLPGVSGVQNRTFYYQRTTKYETFY